MALDLYTLLLSVPVTRDAIASAPSIMPVDCRGFQALANVLGLSSVSELTCMFAEPSLSEMTKVLDVCRCMITPVFCIQNVSEWSATSIEVTQFCTLLQLCDGQTFEQKFHQADSVFIHCMVDDQQEPKLRLIAHVYAPRWCSRSVSRLCFLTLLKSLSVRGMFQQLKGPLLSLIIQKWLLPVMAWRAGKSAACIRCVTHKLSSLWIAAEKRDRFMALTVLETMARMRWLDGSHWKAIAQKSALFPSLQQSLDEDYFPETRWVTLLILTHLSDNIEAMVTGDTVEQLCLDVLTRFEDTNDEIRCAACQTLHAVVIRSAPSCLPPPVLERIRSRKNPDDIEHIVIPCFCLNRGVHSLRRSKSTDSGKHEQIAHNVNYKRLPNGKVAADN